MGIIEDVMKALERIPAWKRISALPQEVDELKERIAVLEAKLGPKSGEECTMCSELSMKVISSVPHPEFGFAGMKIDTLRCSACAYEETRDRDPSKRQ